MDNPRPRYCVSALAVGFLLTTSLSAAAFYPDRPILLICPWAAGGGTDIVSRNIAAHLETQLHVPVNVINASGGKGVTGHSRGLRRARPDGYTLTMATLELNMMHWSGLTSLTVDDCEPLVSLNEDYAAVFAMADAPWRTLPDLEQAIRAEPGQLRASGTATGGAWHLAAAGWLIAAEMQADDLNWVSSTGAGPSLQELISGGLDLVCCSLPEANALLASGQIRALGVMAPQRLPEFAEIPTFREQGTDWVLGGWRAIVVPRGTPPAIQQRLRETLLRVVQGETRVGDTTFPQFMQQAGFDHHWRTGEDLQQFLNETDRKLGTLLTSESMRSVNQDRFPPMAFPGALIILLGLTGAGLLVPRWRGAPPLSTDTAAEEHPNANWWNFALVVGAVLIYVVCVETVGFVLLSFLLMVTLSYRLGVSWRTAILASAVFSVTVYQVFAHLLRVPLPRGWLGW